MPSEGKAEMKRRRASRESLFVRLFQDDGPAAAVLGTTSIPLAEIIPTKEKEETTIRRTSTETSKQEFFFFCHN